MSYICATAICGREALVTRRLNSCTVIPLCLECSASIEMDQLLDGEAFLNIKRDRLMFSPEKKEAVEEGAP